MLLVTAEAQRVSRGPVIWVAANVTRDRNYWPACEGLMWEWWKRGGESQLYRPLAWTKNGLPGSGGRDWFRADWEYCMCFKRPGELPWSDNTACGHEPVYQNGGACSNRMTNGLRVNDPFGFDRTTQGRGRFKDGRPKPGGRSDDAFGIGRSSSPGARRANGDLKTPHTKREPDGSMRVQKYAKPKLANPGTVLRVEVGGGRMGSPLSHLNEAPYPVGIPDFFIRSLCPPGGTVLDCFSGSGTTVSVARRLGRTGIGIDLRLNQCELGRRRLAEPERVAKAKRPARVVPGEPLLFPNPEVAA
jgi:hypothetical protein